MKTRLLIRCSMLLTVVALGCIMASCGGDRYHEVPFGGMKGRVQKVTITHRLPEMWHAGEKGSDIMYITASVYDSNGNEICSAFMDSTGYVQVEAESIFENGVCIRSVQKTENRVVARLNLTSQKKGLYEYNKEVNGKMVHMKVKKSSFRRRFKSVVSEDDVITTVSIINTDRSGHPIRIKDIDVKADSETVQENVYDENYNIIEKHIAVKGEEKDEIIYTEYYDFDEKGNWRAARTYNRNRLPVEVLQREIEYW